MAGHSFHHTKPQGSFLFWFGLMVVFHSGYVRELDGRMETILEIVFFFISFFQLLPPKYSSYNNIITQSAVEVP